MKLAEQQRKIKYLIIKGYKNTLIFETHLFFFCIKQKRAGIETKETCSYRLISFKHRAVGGAINSPPVIGLSSTRDTSSCPIIYEFVGLVYENTQSEGSISP